MSHRQSLLARRPLGRALRLFFVAALLVVGAGTAPAGPTRAEEPVPGGGVSPEGLLNADGTLDLSTGFEGTLDLRGWEVTLDGERGPVLEPASVSAASDPAWGALSNGGLNGTVSALAVMGSDLYVGGTFTQTVDGAVSDLGNIARYDTRANTWHALPREGLNDVVVALAAVDDDLYVGGAFTQTGDGTPLSLNRIARYDTAGGTWHALPEEGLDNTVRALAMVGDDLYVGGTFTQTGDGTPLSLNRIARYDAAGGTWHALPKEGLNNTVRALAVMGDDLYVGGSFTATGDGTVSDLNRIARYDITDDTWNALPREGLSHYVYALAAVGDDLYVGGTFTQTGDVTLLSLNRIARYDTAGSTWHALPNQGLNGYVRALVAVGSDLYLGGGFTQTGDGMMPNLNRIARYDTTARTWNALPNQGLDNNVFALAVVGDGLYVGGAFGATSDGTVTDLGSVARYDTTTIAWRALPNRGLNNDVYALAAVGSDLYVGGVFTQTGDVTSLSLNRIARYDTVGDGTWHALPNQGLVGGVLALAVMGSDLYVGGYLLGTGDGTLNNLGSVARYDTTGGTWHALSNQGLDYIVYALAVVGDDLYVGGEFTSTGDGTVTNLRNIARYDTADGTWHALPNQGLNSYVYALAAMGDDLYVGGDFTQTGDGTVTNLWHIARYDIANSTWHALPNQGLNSAVFALAVMGDDLYVGGAFTATGDGTILDLGRIARYDTAGGTWHALSNQGLNSSVDALAAVGSDLYVGGRFVQTGDGTLTDLGHIARYSTAGDIWHALPNQGLNSGVDALAAVDDDLYVGGDFIATGDGTVSGLGGIARYNLYPYKVYLPLVIRQ